MQETSEIKSVETVNQIKRNNINIGQDYWIVWIDPDLNSVTLIDDLLDSTWGFWQQLEIQCNAECCGIYAFTFWPEDIKKAFTVQNQTQFLADIAQLKESIEASPFNSVKSDKFNDTIEKSVFVRIITHVEHSIKGWVS